MKIISVLVIVFISFQIVSCSNCKDTSKTSGQEKTKIKMPPNSVAQNLSIVTAKVDEVLFKSETDYQIEVTALNVSATEMYPSIAVVGNKYLLTPNFRYDGEGLLENDINNSLKKIGKLSKGTEFKAEISLENGKGWFLQKVLND
jgi:hypothetical protein